MNRITLSEVALVAAGSWLFTMLWCAGQAWRTWPAEPDYLTALLFAIWLAPMAGNRPCAGSSFL
jgi:hypothetical protein